MIHHFQLIMWPPLSPSLKGKHFHFVFPWNSPARLFKTELLQKHTERQKKTDLLLQIACQGYTLLSVVFPSRKVSNTIQFLPLPQLGLTRSSKCLFSEGPGGVTLSSLSTFINLSTEVCSLIWILWETLKLDFFFLLSLLVWHMLDNLSRAREKSKCLLFLLFYPESQ